MNGSKPQDVDSYIAAAPEEARPILEELRTIIRTTLPNVEEKISWGVPFYQYHGGLGGYAVYRKHVSFGCDAVIEESDRVALERSGYKAGKKTFQIAFDQKVPAAVIRRMVKAKGRENDARGRSSAG